MGKNDYESIVPDTSIIIEGVLSKRFADKKIAAKKIVIHEAVLSELEHQANMNNQIGFMGLKEISTLREISKKSGFDIEFSGKRPSATEIKYAKLGEIDSMIRELAFDTNSVLVTSVEGAAGSGIFSSFTRPNPSYAV